MRVHHVDPRGSKEQRTLACSATIVVRPQQYTPGISFAGNGTPEPPCPSQSPQGTYPEIDGSFEPASGEPIPCTNLSVVPKELGGEATLFKILAEQKALPTVDESRPVVGVALLDALIFPDGKEHAAPEGPLTIYARVPPSWIANGALTPRAKADLLAKMYGGPKWEAGNFDGSRYVVKSFTSRTLSREEIAKLLAASDESPKGTWFYETTPDGELEKRGPAFTTVKP